MTMVGSFAGAISVTCGGSITGVPCECRPFVLLSAKPFARRCRALPVAYFASSVVSSVPALLAAVNALRRLVYAATAFCTSARGSGDDAAGDGACSDGFAVGVPCGAGFGVQPVSASSATSTTQPNQRFEVVI